MPHSKVLSMKTLIGVLLCIHGAGCVEFGTIPDQSQFASLDSLSTNGQAIVRLYSAPIPDYENVGSHPWFVIKTANETEFDRWEVLDRTDVPFGYVHLNFSSPAADIGAGGVSVLAELIGPAAESIVTFIETQSLNYPCRNEYTFFPGPNSNTFGQWVLDNTGWDVTLPFTAIGKDVTPDCE